MLRKNKFLRNYLPTSNRILILRIKMTVKDKISKFNHVSALVS